MTFDCKLVQPEDVDSLLAFEEARYAEMYPDFEERMFHSWSSRSRKESLEHYSKLGWSFKVVSTESNKIQGFILAQPLLFVAGNTQSLWVEHLSTVSMEVRDLLTEVIYKLSREKHLQGVYFPNRSGIQNSIAAFNPKPWSEEILFVSTVKR
jgi:hypothetical protein